MVVDCGYRQIGNAGKLLLLLLLLAAVRSLTFAPSVLPAEASVPAAALAVAALDSSTGTPHLHDTSVASGSMLNGLASAQQLPSRSQVGRTGQPACHAPITCRQHRKMEYRNDCRLKGWYTMTWRCWWEGKGGRSTPCEPRSSSCSSSSGCVTPGSSSAAHGL